MLAHLRQEANANAQSSLRALVDNYGRTGHWDRTLVVRYELAERLVDMVDEAIVTEQRNDPEAPDLFPDVLAAADLERARRRETTACDSCGNDDPVRLGNGGCDRCKQFPRCFMCRRWTGDGFLPAASLVWFSGKAVEVCDVCMERADQQTPDDGDHFAGMAS